MKVKIVTKKGTFFETNNSEFVSLKLSSGSIGFKDKHIDTKGLIVPGEIKITENNKINKFFTSSGVLYLKDNILNIFLDYVSNKDDLKSDLKNDKIAKYAQNNNRNINIIKKELTKK